MSILGEYYASNHWRLMSLQRKRHDGFRCVLCANLDIQVHHNCYERLGHEKIFDLVTLCERCHRLYHVEVMKNIPREWRLIFTSEEALVHVIGSKRQQLEKSETAGELCSGLDCAYQCPYCLVGYGEKEAWYSCDISKDTKGRWSYFCHNCGTGDILDAYKAHGKRREHFEYMQKIEDELVLKEREKIWRKK